MLSANINPRSKISKCMSFFIHLRVHESDGYIMTFEFLIVFYSCTFVEKFLILFVLIAKWGILLASISLCGRSELWPACENSSCIVTKRRVHECVYSRRVFNLT